MTAGLVTLCGCAQPPNMPTAQRAEAPAYWRGRLVLRVDADPEPKAYYANFELSGQARAGELRLTTPLGTTVAHLQWNPQLARLTRDGQTRAFESVDALATEATGAAIPLAVLFEWLQGESVSAAGWHADLAQLGEGRIVAHRIHPEPAAELRLILEQP